MKIKSESADQISLRDRSLGAFSGMLILLIGIGLLAVLLFIPGATQGQNAFSAREYLIGSAIAIISGLSAIFFSPSYSIDITKTQIHYVRKALFGAREDQTYHSLDVAQVAVKMNFSGSDDENVGMKLQNRPHSTLQIILLFKDGTQLLIGNRHNANPGALAATTFSNLYAGSKEIKTAQKIAEFLNVPFQKG